MSNRVSRGMGLLLTLGLTGMGLFFLAFIMVEGRRIDNPMPVFALLMGGGIFAATMLAYAANPRWRSRSYACSNASRGSSGYNAATPSRS